MLTVPSTTKVFDAINLLLSKLGITQNDHAKITLVRANPAAKYIVTVSYQHHKIAFNWFEVGGLTTFSLAE